MIKHQVSKKTGLCRRCIKKLSRPVAACSRCSQIKPIYDEKNWFCKVCKDIVSYKLRKQAKAQLGKVECSVCGQLRVSNQLKRNIFKKAEVRRQKAEGIPINKFRGFSIDAVFLVLRRSEIHIFFVFHN